MYFSKLENRGEEVGREVSFRSGLLRYSIVIRSDVLFALFRVISLNEIATKLEETLL